MCVLCEGLVLLSAAGWSAGLPAGGHLQCYTAIILLSLSHWTCTKTCRDTQVHTQKGPCACEGMCTDRTHIYNCCITHTAGLTQEFSPFRCTMAHSALKLAAFIITVMNTCMHTLALFLIFSHIQTQCTSLLVHSVFTCTLLHYHRHSVMLPIGQMVVCWHYVFLCLYICLSFTIVISIQSNPHPFGLCQGGIVSNYRKNLLAPLFMGQTEKPITV